MPFPIIITSVLGASVALAPDPVAVESVTLENGMTILLVPRSDTPGQVAAGWLARVGSVNDSPETAGLSEFVQRALFAGTGEAPAGPTSVQTQAREQYRLLHDYTDLVFWQVRYPRWRRGMVGQLLAGPGESRELDQLRQVREQLIVQQGPELRAGPFDGFRRAIGENLIHAGTTHDFTLSYVTIGADQIDAWARGEAERLAGEPLDQIDARRDALQIERINTPQPDEVTRTLEAFDAFFWAGSGYAWPVVARARDFNRYTSEAARAHFQAQYRPSNLVILLVGDFQGPSVRPILERTFGALPAAPAGTAAADPAQPRATGQREERYDWRAAPQLLVAYRTVPKHHADEPALAVLARLLNLPDGPMREALGPLVSSVSRTFASQDSRRFAGRFTVEMELADDADRPALLARWQALLAALAAGPIPDAHLASAKAAALRSPPAPGGDPTALLLELACLEGLRGPDGAGGWELLARQQTRIEAVTAADLQRVVRTYLAPDDQVIAHITRTPIDPELEALAPEARQKVRALLERILQREDPAQIRMMLSMLQSQLPSVPESEKPILQLVVKKLQERLEELEAAPEEGPDDDP